MRNCTLLDLALSHHQGIGSVDSHFGFDVDHLDVLCKQNSIVNCVVLTADSSTRPQNARGFSPRVGLKLDNKNLLTLYYKGLHEITAIPRQFAAAPDHQSWSSPAQVQDPNPKAYSIRHCHLT